MSPAFGRGDHRGHVEVLDRHGLVTLGQAGGQLVEPVGARLGHLEAAPGVLGLEAGEADLSTLSCPMT
ncbi:MAG: hypothetical protein M0008_12765 [Actinomycetota bacterium]|nr:hypothetical protein [Actinomycetota bacterium]